MQRDDAALIRSCLDGSQQAWGDLIDRYARLVYSIPRRYHLSDADAEDIVQQVFTLLFRHLGSLQDRDRVSAWLITTTQRECWRVIRQSRRLSQSSVASGDASSVADQSWPAVSRPSASSAAEDLASEPGSSESASEIEVQRLEQQHLVRMALQQLGGRCEKLLTALFRSPAQGDYEAIARQLDMRIGSIGPTRARCFAKLETILRELGFDPDLDAP